jgi:hypothetical protein
MKKAFGIIIISALVTNAQAQNPNPSMEDISYALGVLFAKKTFKTKGLKPSPLPKCRTASPVK